MCVILVLRTQRPFYRSRPGRWLILATAGVAIMALVVLYSPLGGLLGLTPLPVSTLLLVLGITGLYVVATEAAKRVYYRRLSLQRG